VESEANERPAAGIRKVVGKGLGAFGAAADAIVERDPPLVNRIRSTSGVAPRTTDVTGTSDRADKESSNSRNPSECLKSWVRLAPSSWA